LKFNHIKFESLLPSFFNPLQDILKSYGFIPTLVGGCVRDFFRDNSLGKDWDIELSHQTLSFSKDFWKDFGKSLNQLGKVSHLPYDVLRLQIGEYQLEFSPPRREIFTPDLSHLGHKNFTVNFDFRMPFEESVLRRDFTINAIGIKFSSQGIELLDPLKGLEHLKEKILHPAGPDFSNDPVRFLRALRFSIKYGLDFSSTLSETLKQMQVAPISSLYLWNEMIKSNHPFDFYSELTSWAPFHPEMKFPISSDIKTIQSFLMNDCSQYSWLLALEWAGISGEPWQQYFSLSHPTYLQIKRWVHEAKVMKDIYPESFHGEFQDNLGKDEFLSLFQWYFSTKQLLQKHSELKLLILIEKNLSHWIHLYKFELLSDVKHIDPPLRAKYQVWNLCQKL